MELTVCCCVYVCTIGVRVVQEEPANTEVKHSEHGREDTCVSVHHCEIDEWLSGVHITMCKHRVYRVLLWCIDDNSCSLQSH